jgi:hypothetical protein
MSSLGPMGWVRYPHGAREHPPTHRTSYPHGNDPKDQILAAVRAGRWSDSKSVPDEPMPSLRGPPRDTFSLDPGGPRTGAA